MIYSTRNHDHTSVSSFCVTPFWVQRRAPYDQMVDQAANHCRSAWGPCCPNHSALTRTTITQQTSGSGSPAIGSAGGNVTITLQHGLQPSATQPPATSPAPSTLQGHPWWQQPPVIAAMIAAIATLVAALIQRARTTSPAKTQARRPRRKP